MANENASGRTEVAAWRSVAAAIPIGAVAGIASGLLGVGGGLVMVPVMVLALRVPQHEAHATSLAAIAPIAAVGALIFGSSGSADVWAALALGAGSIPGALLGAEIMRRTDERRLRVGFGVLVLAVSVLMVVR